MFALDSSGFLLSTEHNKLILNTCYFYKVSSPITGNIFNLRINNFFKAENIYVNDITELYFGGIVAAWFENNLNIYNL